jgi:hypothetical protein
MRFAAFLVFFLHCVGDVDGPSDGFKQAAMKDGRVTGRPFWRGSARRARGWRSRPNAAAAASKTTAEAVLRWHLLTR